MKFGIRLLIAGAGLALFAWFVLRAGPAEIWHTALGLGWRAPLALVPYALVYVADTWGWRSALGGAVPRRLAFLELYRVRWCGEAVNNVVPSGTVGGEAIKVYLLQKRGIPPADGAAAAVIGRTVQTLMQVGFIAVGTAALLRVAPHAQAMHHALAAVLMAGVAAVTGLFWLQARGTFSLLLRLPAWFPGRMRLEASREHFRDIDQRIRDFYRRDARHFLRCAAGYGGGWLLDSCDVWLVAWLLGTPISWLQALAVESFIGIAKALAMVVPGALGAQESGIAVVCHYAGLPVAVGPAYALIRRGRDLVFAGIGWLLLYSEEGRFGLAGVSKAGLP